MQFTAKEHCVLQRFRVTLLCHVLYLLHDAIIFCLFIRLRNFLLLSFDHCSAPQSRIPGPGFSSSAVAKVQQRTIRKSQNRTYSYLQAVDRDISNLSGDSEGSSEGSRNTSPFPSGPVDSEKLTGGNASQNLSPLSQRKTAKDAMVKEHTPPSSIPVLASMSKGNEPTSNERKGSLRDDSSGAVDESQHTAVAEKATSPWRKGRVSELRAVFAKKEGSPPPLPDAGFLSASGRALSSDESPILSPVGKHPVYKEPGSPTGDRIAKPVFVGNRFGFVGGSVHRSAGPLSPRPVGHDTRTLEKEAVKPQAAELAEPTNAEQHSQVGLSVRDRTANWEKKYGLDHDVAPQAAKPIADTTLSPHSGNKEGVGNRMAASSVESLRRKSAGDTVQSQGRIPVPNSLSSRKGNESGGAQKDRPLSEVVLGQQLGLRRASEMASANRSDNLPSYAHRFSSSGTSRSTTPKGHAPADLQSGLPVKHRLGPKPALQGNVSNNNNGNKGAVHSHVRNTAFATKLPVQNQTKPTNLGGSSRPDTTYGQVSTTQQPLPKPITLTHPASSPSLRLRSQSLEYTQCENGASSSSFRRNSSDQGKPKQSLIRKQSNGSETQSTAAVQCPFPAATSGLPIRSLKGKHSSAETLTGTPESHHALARRSSLKERHSPQAKGSVESVEQQDGLVAKEECIYPWKISGDKELSNTTFSSIPFERQLSTDSHSTATGGMHDSVVLPAMPPEVPQVCMDDISSNEGSGEVRFRVLCMRLNPVVRVSNCS